VTVGSPEKAVSILGRKRQGNRPSRGRLEAAGLHCFPSADGGIEKEGQEVDQERQRPLVRSGKERILTLVLIVRR